MQYDKIQTKPVDSRILIYRILLQIIIIVAIGLGVKTCFIDTVRVQGDQMAPTILNGDRILIFRTPYLGIFQSFLPLRRNRAVVFNRPSNAKMQGCLRIAAFSGQRISIDSGICKVTTRNKTFVRDFRRGGDVLPKEFSPRDFCAPYTIPSKGDTLVLDSLSLRDFFYAVSIIRQENRDKKIELKPIVIMRDSIYSDFAVTDFSLYKGRLSAIPEEYRYDWFFWDHLRDYLRYSQGDSLINLTFGLVVDGNRVERYRVGSSYVFLLADNWAGGLDSRYFGLVNRRLIRGSTLCVAWSYGPGNSGRNVLRIGRFGRLLLR